MKIVVTGSNGLVGSRLARTLEAQGHEVLGMSRGEKAPGGPERYVSVDLAEQAAVDAALDAFVPEAIINPASMTEVDKCELDPVSAWRANVTVPANLAQAARRLNAHLVHVSTDYVFDGDRGGYSEEDVPNPRGVYAITKHAGEQAVRALAPSHAIARTAVVYGWPMAARANFGAWLVSALAKGNKVNLFSDQFVSPSLADNVADMLAELTTRKLQGIFNTCGADVVDRVTFGNKVCDIFGFDPSLINPTRLAEARLASPRPLRSGLLTNKVAETLSVKPLGLDESLRRFHEMWKQAQPAAA